jgi:hypothetical protein
MPAKLFIKPSRSGFLGADTQERPHGNEKATTRGVVALSLIG